LKPNDSQVYWSILTGHFYLRVFKFNRRQIAISRM